MNNYIDITISYTEMVIAKIPSSTIGFACTVKAHMPSKGEDNIVREEDIKRTDKYVIQTISRAMKVIDVLSKEPQGLTLDQLTDVVGLRRAMVYRILITLELEGLVERTAEKPITYTLGLKCLMIGAGMLAWKVAMPQTQEILDEAAQHTGESVGLHVRWGSERLCIASSRSSYPPMYRIEVLKTAPLCFGSIGKLLLAYMPYEEAKRALQDSLPVIRRYPGTPSEIDVVLGELEVIRRNGFAVSTQEMSSDAKSVSIPVRNADNSVFAGLELVARTERLPDSRIPELVAELKKASKHLQRLLRGGSVGD